MRKIIFACVFAMLMCPSVFAATSDDVYLRRDVFDAKMDSFMAEMRLMFEQNRREIEQKFDKRISEVEQKLDKRISEVEQKLDKRIGEVEQKFDKRIDELDKKIDSVQTELKLEIQDLRSDIKVINERTESTKTSVYWILAALSVIVATPHMQKFLQWHEINQQHERESLFTKAEVEALRRLLAMNESGFAGK